MCALKSNDQDIFGIREKEMRREKALQSGRLAQTERGWLPVYVCKISVY